MATYYRDFREHLRALEERHQLVHITREINKDTELMPLVRWQFRGLDERERKAFIFENVTDSRGRRYNMPVTVGTLAATTEIYAIGLMCEPDQIHERWTQAQLQPIEPVKVANAPAQEMGEGRREPGGALWRLRLDPSQHRQGLQRYAHRA